MSIQNERFTVIFNTRGSNVLFPDTTSANVKLNQVIYDVNWLSILPTKYKNFQCNFVFKSDVFKSNFNGTPLSLNLCNDTGFINMNIGRTNINDGLQISINIGSFSPIAILAIPPTVNIIPAVPAVPASGGNPEIAAIPRIIETILTGVANSYYCSTTNDNNEFWIDYPTNNQITITFNKMNRSLFSSMEQYCLYLTLTGILDNEIDKSN